MKKNFLKLITIVLVLTACNNRNENKDNENGRSDSLQGIVDEKTALITGFLTLFNDIEKNLDSISKREKRIRVRTENPQEVKSIVIEEINKDISVINDIIKTNKRNILNVNHKLKEAIKKNGELEKAINTLNQQLSNKESDLTMLKNKLDEYDSKIITLITAVGILNAENAVLQETVAEETEMLHTAYYIIGKAKELEKDSIIDKKGGLLGIGKTSELNNNFNPDKFTKIDNIETTSIPVNAKKIKIISTHPANSYSLDEKGNVKNILINDPEKFWSISKYLVIVKN